MPPPAEATPPPALTPAPAWRAHQRRLMYVDDNANRRRRTELMLQEQRDDWKIVCAENGVHALELLNQLPFDAFITELQMEEMNGVELLNKVVKRYPKTLRFIRCSAEERGLIQSCLGTPPNVLPRECDAAAFQSIVDRAFRLEEWMANPAVQKLYSQMTQLPALPALYNQVLSELQSPNGSLEFVARLIAKDPVMTAKMLQMVNSALFALLRQITEPIEAVMLLGAERVKSLILLSQVFTQFDKTKCPGFHFEQLWMHCMATGAHSMAITMAEAHDAHLAEMAYTAGLLHDIGKVLLAGNLPAQYSKLLAQATQRKVSVREVEQETFGASHAEAGACLLGSWGLPLPILEAIALHHCPGDANHRAFSLLTAVHVGSALDYEKRAGTVGPTLFPMDMIYLERLGLLDHLPRWRELCGCKNLGDAAETMPDAA